MPYNLKRDRLTVHKKDLRSAVLPLLRGTVFHVTTQEALEKILDSRVIHSNQYGRLGYTFPQSQSSYGRRRGYVCLFDLRTATDDELEDALMKFYFLDPASFRGHSPAFLFLSPAEHSRLIPWTTARESGEMWVPYVECWFPGDVPVEKIDRVLELEVEREPDAPWIVAMRKVAESNNKPPDEPSHRA